RARIGDHLIADASVGLHQLRADSARRPGDDGNFPLGCHARSLSWVEVYSSEKMGPWTGCGFASVAQLLSFLAAGQATIPPTLRRYWAGVRPVACRNAPV